MSRTRKDKKGYLKLIKDKQEKFPRVYSRHKLQDDDLCGFYRCIDRKGTPGVLSDDWGCSEDAKSLYEYFINHENEAA